MADTGLSLSAAKSNMFKSSVVAGVSGGAFLVVSNAFVATQFANSTNPDMMRALLQAFLGFAVAFVTWRKAPRFAVGVLVAAVAGAGVRIARAQGWDVTVSNWFRSAQAQGGGGATGNRAAVAAGDLAVYDRIGAVASAGGARDAAIAALSTADRAAYERARVTLGNPAGALASARRRPYAGAGYREAA